MTKLRGPWRRALALGAVIALIGTATHAETTAEAPERPRHSAFEAVFVQRGVGEEVDSFTIGLLRHLPKPWLSDRTELLMEMSISQWQAKPHAPRDTGNLVQLAVKPTLRHTLIPGHVSTFAEIGIGLTLSSEVYRKRERQFSTTFNFGDHLGVGWSFGERHAHEIVLRVEHFSNADIVQPNPGENFRELRYVHWF
jgi:lipid A 3-O-deacylase